MKSNGTLLMTVKVIVFGILLSSASSSVAQPRFQFSNPALVSGTSNTAGAVYRFSDVNPSTDALVTITQISGNITLRNIDRTADGYSEAFQPEYNVAANSSGYIDFSVVFVKKNTNESKSQSNIVASGLDIDGHDDGGNKLYEFNTIDLGGGFVDFDMLGGHLSISNSGTAFTGNNISGVLFGALVDTSGTPVMFSVENNHVSSFTYRVGATNNMTRNFTRYASLYFAKFNFNNSFLSISCLKSFNGVKKNNSLELNWVLGECYEIKTITIEKSVDGKNYSPLQEFKYYSAASIRSSYTDNNFNSTSYYRLKAISQNGKTEYSNAIVITNSSQSKNNSLKVYPTIITNNATVSVNADKSEQAVLQMIDLNGRVVSQQHMLVAAGSNNISFSKPSTAIAGTYVLAVKAGNTVQTQKVIIQ